MDASRFRLGAILEWVAAAGCIIALFTGLGYAAREVRGVQAVMPVIAREAPAPLIAAPAAIPPGAVSLPVLLLGKGVELRVGETASAVLGRLDRGDEITAPATERAPNGERVTRTFHHGRVVFRLVFEPFEKNAEPRLAAIYR